MVSGYYRVQPGGYYTLYQRSEQGFGLTGATAALSLDQAIGPIFRKPSATPFFDRFGGRLADIDLVPDLGARIGSREWFRGLATCIALCSSAIALSPGFNPIVGATPAPFGESQWEQARAQAIAPIAWGSDTGRRMAATDLVQPLAEIPERPSINLTATIGQGDGFARVLERAGVSDAEALRIGEMLDGAIPIADVKRGTKMELVLGRRANRHVPRPLDSLAFRARFDLKLAVVRVDGALQLERIPIAVDDTPLRIQGVVGDSLYRAARAAGAPAKAIEAYLRAIGSKLRVNRDIPADARFDLIVEHRRAETGEVEVGQLLFAGLDRGSRKTQLLRWTMDGESQWFEASGVGRKQGVMVTPVTGRQSSGFGMRRHPILGYSRMHKGMDFAAGHGTPIRAATDGVVDFAGRNRGYGTYVRIKHSGGLATAYAHMSRIAARAGARVRQGQVIGYVGSTGLSTGPHLHYELYRNGVAINPRSVKYTSQAQLGGSELRAFKAKLSELLAVAPGAAAQVARAEEKPVRIASR